MFDRKTYNRIWRRNQRNQRKAEGRCVTCGVKLTLECTTLQCEHCREKQKYQNVGKVNISKLIAEAKTYTVRNMQERLKEAFKHYPQKCGGCCKEKIDQIAKELLEDT